MARALLIVDPQIDFISGSLPVPGAGQAMNSLADHIIRNNGRWAIKIVTCDWHPWNHCSFADIGGPWPKHCVAHSAGAAIWPALLPALHDTTGATTVLTKGRSQEQDEYSIFQNQQSGSALKNIFTSHSISGVDICGIAGDICVLSTLEDGIKLYDGSFFTVLNDFSPSLDGGVKLADFCQRMGQCTR